VFEAEVASNGEGVGRARRANATGEAFEDGEVVSNGEVREDARRLRDITEAAAGTLVKGQAGDVLAGEEDLAFRREKFADKDAEEGGFARAARAEDGDDFARTRFEGGAVEKGAAGEAHGEGGGEEGHWGSGGGG
jgi:hypothetical protein